MKRFFRILLGLIGAVIALMVLAAIVLPLIYDKEDLEKAIADKVNEQTGRELSINGGLDFSVFPWLAVEAGDLSLSNAPDFGDQPFARIGQARVGIALLPLFSRRIAADEITLDGLDLALTVDAAGRSNWGDLSKGEKTGTSDSGESLFSGGRIAGLRIRDANIDYRDQQVGAHYRMNGFSMQTGALGDGRPVDVELSAVLEDVAAGSKAEIELATTAGFDLEAEKHRFTDLRLAVLFASEGIGEKLQFHSPAVLADLTTRTLKIDSFSIELGDLNADGSLAAQDILEQPSFSGSLSIGQFSPARLMQMLRMDIPPTADPEALQSARLDAGFAGSTSQLSIDDLNLELDKSRITGQLNIRDFDRPVIGFTFDIDEINLDRYLEPASDEPESVNVSLPREELQGQEVRGTLKAGKLVLAGLEFDDAEIGITISAGKLHVQPLKAGFYGGSYNGDISIDSSGNVPVLSLNQKIDSITFQRLVSALIDDESLSGMAQGHLQLSGSGASSNEVLGNLHGDLGLTLTEGALEGINLWYEIRRGFALYKGLAPPDAEPARTVFSRMQLAADIENGVMQTRELFGELPFLTVRGNGAIDLGRSTVDLGLVAAVRNAPELAKDPLTADLGGKSLPFRVSGSLEDPAVSVDWEELLKSEAADMLLDRLGLRPDDSTAEDAESEPEEAASEDQLEETAKGLLYELLKSKNQDKNDGG